MRKTMKRVISLFIFLMITGCTAIIVPIIVPSPDNSIKAELITTIKAKANSDEAKKLIIANIELDKLTIEQLQELDKKISQTVSSPVITASPLPTPTMSPTASPVATSRPFPTPTASPLPTPSPTISPEQKPPCAGGQGLPCVPEPTPKYSPPYSTAKPVSPDLRSGSISLTFKDEFKVRYNREQKLFTSQTGQDTIVINNLMSEYMIKNISGEMGGLTQEQADEEEKRVEDALKYDYRNYGSRYLLTVENINVQEFVYKLRLNNLVREANLPEKVVPQ